MEYDANPAAEGKAYLLFAVLLVLINGVSCVVDGLPGTGASVVIALTVAGLAAWGVWQLRFRRKPLKRTVVLGTMAHHLYMRSKLLFVVYEVMACLVLMFVIMFIIGMIEGEGGLVFNKLIKDVWSACMLFVCVAYKVAQDYYSFYSYYLSSGSARQVKFDGKPGWRLRRKR